MRISKSLTIAVTVMKYSVARVVIVYVPMSHLGKMGPPPVRIVAKIRILSADAAMNGVTLGFMCLHTEQHQGKR
jgi:hypothetical protein